VRERRGDGDALLLTTRQLGRTCVSLVGESDALEQLVGAVRSLFRRVPCEAQLETDQLARRQLG
jgi:hypothetical protein